MIENLTPVKIIEEIEALANGKLKLKDDLARIVELAVNNNQLKNLEELSFTAKYIQGLIKIIQNHDNNIDEKYFSTVKTELTQNIDKLKSQLDSVLQNGSNFIKNIYSEKFFKLSQESLSNLNLLCSDLTFVKLYLNDLKRDINKK